MGHDLIHETFTLVAAAYSQAPECIAKATAGGNQIHFLIKHAAGVIQVGVPADAF